MTHGSSTLLTARLATLADLPALLTLLLDAKAQMQKQGFQQWDERYPNRQVLVADINQARLWTLGTTVDAAISIECDEDNSTWHLHRLMVRSVATHQGLAAKLLAMAEQAARRNDVRRLEVTTHLQNLPMRYLLAQAGYTCGDVFLMPGREAFGGFVSYQYFV